MNTHVGVEGGGAIETLATHATAVRLLGRVNDLVTTEGACLPEALATHFAHERPRPRVYGHVTCEVVVGVEMLATVGTREGLLTLTSGSASSSSPRCRQTLWR